MVLLPQSLSTEDSRIAQYSCYKCRLEHRLRLSCATPIDGCEDGKPDQHRHHDTSTHNEGVLHLAPGEMTAQYQANRCANRRKQRGTHVDIPCVIPRIGIRREHSGLQRIAHNQDLQRYELNMWLIRKRVLSADSAVNSRNKYHDKSSMIPYSSVGSLR